MVDSSALSSLIVRNIADLEAAVLHAKDTIDTRLFADIGGCLLESLDRAVWFASAEPEDEDIWFAARDWIPSGTEPEQAPYWLKLEGQSGPSGGEEYTWLAAFLEAGPEGATVALVLRGDTFDSKRRWKALLKAEPEIVTRLLEAGFKQDDGQKLFIPLRLDSELLALGFEDDNLTQALEPLREALRIVEAAKPDLDALIAIDSKIDD